jgi:hypothetical protein
MVKNNTIQPGKLYEAEFSFSGNKESIALVLGQVITTRFSYQQEKC